VTPGQKIIPTEFLCQPICAMPSRPTERRGGATSRLAAAATARADAANGLIHGHPDAWKRIRCKCPVCVIVYIAPRRKPLFMRVSDDPGISLRGRRRQTDTRRFFFTQSHIEAK